MKVPAIEGEIVDGTRIVHFQRDKIWSFWDQWL